ncbi:MAG: exodeoxyribonuclease VII small subunit [Nitrospinae bacterium]|nr:exodeoxyribonuclease VII small subunit [Nitrospinota bacterium]
MAKKTDETKFEGALARLEEIVSRLEKGDVELDEALTLFTEGTQMAQLCQKKLAEAQTRIETLVKDRDGEPATGPMADPTEDAPF